MSETPSILKVLLMISSYLLSFTLLSAEFLENIQHKYIWQDIQLSDLWSEKSDSQMVNIQIVKSFSRPKD